ncbi:MAG: alanine dehydrogenase [Magnetococcales bacterium]|nr:alanine dehydrogenase [Magnetococcales bacterium]
MIIGVVGEIKPDEYRVGMQPSGVLQLTQAGHTVLVERKAGLGSGFSDATYQQAGGKLVDGAASIFAKADLIVKVKEPQHSELEMIRPGQVLFTFFHFAASESMTRALMDKGCVAIAYEMVRNHGRRPLLAPMSVVAGRLAVQEAAHYMTRPHGGPGRLVGGVPGIAPARFTIIGGGVVGEQAARMAAGLGAQVTILDRNNQRLTQLTEMMSANVIAVRSDPESIREWVIQSDVVISSVLITGEKAPHLIDRSMLREMKPGSMIVDVAIDQGGSLETSRATTHSDPVYVEEGVIHYCVANMPGAVPETATRALTNATMDYIQKLADLGWKAACQQDRSLALGLSLADGKVVSNAVARGFGWSAVDRDTVINQP